jgi:hypothetical protein
MNEQWERIYFLSVENTSPQNTCVINWELNYIKTNEMKLN